jgi:hypothetical protein
MVFIIYKPVKEVKEFLGRDYFYAVLSPHPATTRISRTPNVNYTAKAYLYMQRSSVPSTASTYAIVIKITNSEEFAISSKNASKDLAPVVNVVELTGEAGQTFSVITVDSSTGGDVIYSITVEYFAR